MPLSDTAIRQAKPAAKEYTLSDGLGLVILIRPNGSKHWVFRYSFANGRPKMFFGAYPEVSLKNARLMRDQAREQLALGVDPKAAAEAESKAAEAEIEAAAGVVLFKQVAKEWLDFRSPRLTQGRKGSAAQARRYFEKDVLPVLGEMPIREVRRSDVLRVMRRVEERGALNVAEKIRTWLHQLFRYAIVHDYVDINPATDLDIVAAEQPPVKHNPHLACSELGEFVRALRAYRGSSVVRLGVELLLLTGVRTAELRHATHDQFDLEKGLWTISAGTVKQLRKLVKAEGDDVPDYLVPLSRRAIEVVKELQRQTRSYELLLPGCHDPSKTLSENTLNQAIQRMGYKGRLTGHGIRGTLSTALYEIDFPGNWIESQLSHADENRTRKSYNHAMYVENRREMMQFWADFLDELAATTEPFDPKAMPRYRPLASEPIGCPA